VSSTLYLQKGQVVKIPFNALGAIAFVASVGMFIVGGNSSHLSELKDFFWVPIPLGVILLAVGAKQK
jgi:hypothetical protein